MTALTPRSQPHPRKSARPFIGGTLMLAGFGLLSAALILGDWRSLGASTAEQPAITDSMESLPSADHVPRALPELAAEARELTLPRVSNAGYVVSESELHKPAIVLVHQLDSNAESVWLSGRVEATRDER